MKLKLLVRAKTYHKLKERAAGLAKQVETLLNLLRKRVLTDEERRELEAVQKELSELQKLTSKEEKEKEETDKEAILSSNEELEQIKSELSDLQEKLNVARDNVKAQIILKKEAEQKWKQAEEDRKKTQAALDNEKKKNSQLETNLARILEEQDNRPTIQELREIEEERDTVHDEKNQLQQQLDEIQTDLDEMDKLLVNKNTQIANLIKERSFRPTRQQLEEIQKKLDKIKGEAKKWKDKYNNSELEKKYNELLKESLGLKENNDKLREEYEKELERLKNQTNTPNSGLEEKQKEIDLLRKVSETLEKENQVLKETISFFKSDDYSREGQIEKKQQAVEILEERLIDCCSECLVEKEEQKEGLDEAKKEIFQLCERLDVVLPEWLEKEIQGSVTYRQLIKNLSGIHDRKTIVEVQERTEKARQIPEEAFTTTETHKEIKPGIKQFF
jgi:DNA repair exonuclease SbcCD ATPase subunit